MAVRPAPSAGSAWSAQSTRGKMSFETISLLLNWLELGVLFGILFRLARTFDLIASTQRELRRAIHHLGERQSAELNDEAPGGSGDRVGSQLAAISYRS